MADAPRGFFGFARQALAANPTLSPMTALVDVLGRAAGPALPQIGNTISDAYRDNIPANYRVLLSSLLGDRAPITNKDLSPAELATLARVVAGDQAKLPQRVADNQQAAQAQRQIMAIRAARLAAFDAAKPTTEGGVFNTLGIMGSGITPQNSRAMYAGDPQDPQGPQALAAKADARAARAQQGIGAVQYQPDPSVSSGYPVAQGHSIDGVRVGPLRAGVDYGDRNVNALANTLGDFVYKPAPGGGVTIDDTYSWQNALHDSRGNPRSPPSLPQALSQLLSSGNVEGLMANLMPDAASGRQTHITLPAPPPGSFGFGRR